MSVRWIRVLVVAVSGVAVVLSRPSNGVHAQATKNTVWVHATVTNKEGRVVTDLTQGDFTIHDGDAVRPISVFSRDEMPVAISLMLDTSGSMARELPNIQKASELLIDQFIAGDRVNVGTFSVSIEYSTRFTANRQRILEAIGNAIGGSEMPCQMPSQPVNKVKGLPRAGGTWMWDAIECGIKVLQTDGEAFRRVLVLITDGLENGGYATGPSATKMANQVGVLIYAAGLEGQMGRDGGLLKQLTQSTGGAYLPLDRGHDFTPAFKQIAEELHGQYVLGFESQPGAAGNLKVTVGREGLTVRSRKGYVVPNSKFEFRNSKFEVRR